MPPKTHTQAQRDEAIELYRTHGPTHAQNELGIPKATIHSWAKRAGVRTVQGSVTRAATEAAAETARRRRAELAVSLLEDAHKLRAQLWEQTQLVNFGGKDNTLAKTLLDEPLFVDKKNILSAVGIAVDRVLKLEAADADNGVGTAESMLQQLIDGIGIPDE